MFLAKQSHNPSLHLTKGNHNVPDQTNTIFFVDILLSLTNRNREFWFQNLLGRNLETIKKLYIRQHASFTDINTQVLIEPAIINPFVPLNTIWQHKTILPYNSRVAISRNKEKDWQCNSMEKPSS